MQQREATKRPSIDTAERHKTIHCAQCGDVLDLDAIKRLSSDRVLCRDCAFDAPCTD